MNKDSLQPKTTDDYAGIGTEAARQLSNKELIALLREFASIRRVANFLGMKGGTPRRILTDLYRDRGIADIEPCLAARPQDPELRIGGQVLTEGDVTFHDLRREADDVMDKLWDAAQANYEAEEAIGIEQDIAHISIDTDVPIGLIVVGDLHLGAASANPQLVSGLIRGIAEADGLYCVLNGDLLEHGLPGCPDHLRMRQGAKPEWQRRMIKQVVKRARRKIIGVTKGQHEFFGERAGGFDFARELAEIAGCPYLGAGGSLFLDVGGYEYSLGIWHKYKGNSIYDETAGAKRCCRTQGPFDVTFVADKHAPASSHGMDVGNVRRTFLRGGTANLHCEYAKSLGYLNSHFAFPVVIFWPGERRTWDSDDLPEALEYLEHLRTR